MASSKFILDALSDVGGEVAEAQALAATFVDLNGVGANSPAWPWVVSRLVDRLANATEKLETLVRQKALPLLQDMEQVNQRVGGMGGTPMEAKRS